MTSRAVDKILARGTLTFREGVDVLPEVDGTGAALDEVDGAEDLAPAWRSCCIRVFTTADSRWSVCVDMVRVVRAQMCIRSKGWSMRTLAAPERAPLARCQVAGNGAVLLAAALVAAAISASEETGGSSRVASVCGIESIRRFGSSEPAAAMTTNGNDDDLAFRLR